MRGVRRLGKSAGAHEEGPCEVGGGRLPALPVASATLSISDYVRGVLHEVSVQGLRLGSLETWHEGLPILPKAIAKDEPDSRHDPKTSERR